MNDLFGEEKSLFGSVGTDVSKLSGSLANHVGARSKRVLLDDVSQAKFERADLLNVSTPAVDLEALLNLDNEDDIKDNISLQLNGKVSVQALLYYFYLTRLTRFIPGEEIPQ